MAAYPYFEAKMRKLKIYLYKPLSFNKVLIAQMSGHFIDDYYKPPKKPTGKFQKKCPACNGTGKDMPMFSHMVMVPDMIDRYHPKKKPGLFVCERCGGTGQIPLIEPIWMGK